MVEQVSGLLGRKYSNEFSNKSEDRSMHKISTEYLHSGAVLRGKIRLWNPLPQRIQIVQLNARQSD